MPSAVHAPRLRLLQAITLLALAGCLLLSGCAPSRQAPSATLAVSASPVPNIPGFPTATPAAQAVEAAFAEMSRFGEIPTATSPTLWVPQDFPAVQWREVDIPIGFATAGATISSINFTLEYDSNKLYFDNRDLNGDNLPDAIRLGTAAGFAIQFRYEPQGSTSRLVFGISDLIAPIRPIAEGTLLKIQFLPKMEGEAFIRFAANPPVVYRNPQGQTVSGQSIPGSVDIFQGNKTVYLPILNKNFPLGNSIRGKVTENGLNRPGVVVQVQTGQFAWSDAYGNYLIDNLPQGLYTLIAILPNTRFNPPSRVVSLPPNAANQNFAIQPTVIVPTATAPRPPTPTPSGSRCEERIFNGGFESSGGWVIPATSYPAAYVNSPTFQGQRSMRTGIPNTWENRVSSSWTFQEFVIPFNVRSAVLKMHVYPRTFETSTSFSADRQTVRLLDQNNNPLATLVGPMLGNQSFWMYYQFDLRNFTGRAMRLAFETYNDGVGSVTWMFVDTVSLVICF